MENVNEKFNILIVDDRKENLITLESIIESPELNIIQALSGNEALALMLEYNVSLVLMDVQMPGMDGFETAELMRGSERTKQIPIIFITATYRQPKQIFRGYESGAVDYLYKPLDRRILQSKIRAYIEFFKQKHELEITTRQLKKTLEEVDMAKRLAEEATIAKSSFLASMSHEIRTPLNGIIGMTDLILMDSELPEHYYEHLTDIKQSSESLLEIINEILDVSKIEADKLELEHIDFSLRDVLGKVVRLLSVKTFQKSLEFLCHCPPDTIDNLVGDPTRLRQILINLMGNAVKFTETGRIVLSVKQLELTDKIARLEFSVRDTGIGIASDKLPKLFTSFSQADKSTTRTHGGTGLGLSISKKLVEMMGGTISADSTPGEGSCFTFILPLEIGKGEHYEGAICLPAEIKDLHVLLVDMQTDHNRELETFFMYCNIPLTIATTAEAALKLAAKPDAKKYKVILIDHLLQYHNGKQLSNLLEEELPNGATPRFIMLTDDKSIHSTKRIKLAGIDHILFKPVMQKELQWMFQRIFMKEMELPETISATQIKTPGQTFRDLTILLAEDNLINQKIVVQLLSKRGIKVITASNGVEAVERASERKYDMVFMDVQMPEMDGFEATRKIRSNLKGPNVKTPVIALTANAMKGDREMCIESGMNEYISKPLNPDEVFNIIEQYCK
ncbi:MAG: response regulator [Bacteroidales bacterium]|nr:response regulator [Bacteroidales bacterium]